MKDISNKPAETLDLSSHEEKNYPPHALDLSDGKLKQRQSRFYEYVPGVAAPHQDDEFGERVAFWLAGARTRVGSFFGRIGAIISAAVAPLKLYWAIAIGAGLIVGLLIISYIATHKNWLTSFPNGIFSIQQSSKGQNDNAAGGGPNQGKDKAGAATQSPTPLSAEARAAQAAQAGSSAGAPIGGTAAAAGSGSNAGMAVPVPGSGAGAVSSKVTAPLPIQSASAPAPLPAPVPAPAPVLAPAPLPAPLPAPAPILKPATDVTQTVSGKVL